MNDPILKPDKYQCQYCGKESPVEKWIDECCPKCGRKHIHLEFPDNDYPFPDAK